MQSIATLIVDQVEYAAEWRESKAIKWPEDAGRNLEAAARLNRIAADLRKLDGSKWHWRLQALVDKRLEEYCGILSEQIRRIGFGSDAGTGMEFLRDFLSLFPSDDQEGPVELLLS